MTHHRPDYVAFYRRYLKGLEKKGKTYVAWCPFHGDPGDRQKAFSVNPENGLWSCFSCRRGGNAYTFCKKMGIPVENAPDYDPAYEITAASGASPDSREGVSGNPAALRMGKARLCAGRLYNPLAIEWARELRQGLWICEGEADTRTLREAGEQAVGIPAACGDTVLDGVVLVGIREVIVVCHHTPEGRKASARIVRRFPSAMRVRWPVNLPERFTVTDLKNANPGGFVDLLREWAVRPEPGIPPRGRKRAFRVDSSFRSFCAA